MLEYDKLLHLFVGYILATIVDLICHLLNIKSNRNIIIYASYVTVAVGKEIIDHFFSAGECESSDALMTIIGGVIAQMVLLLKYKRK